LERESFESAGIGLAYAVGGVGGGSGGKRRGRRITLSSLRRAGFNTERTEEEHRGRKEEGVRGIELEGG
jgi:hypothetical protein